MSKTRQILDIILGKAVPRDLMGADNSGAWTNIFHTGFDGPGGWFQQDVNIDPYRAQANWAVFACTTLIAGDMGKMDVNLYEDKNGVSQKTQSAYDRLLKTPNQFQTWQQFMERWALSKQTRGNAYVLLDRDRSERVRQMHVLHPDCVTPLISDDGSVYYRLNQDYLSGVDVDATGIPVPASEIIHDRFNCLYHPLVGLSPLYACGLAALSGLEIQQNSNRFFRNSSRPGGILIAPNPITDDKAKQYKAEWEASYAGANGGRTAVLGGGLTYQPIAQNAVDSELIAQLKLSAEMVCSVFHVPAYKVGVGVMPAYQNAEILDQIYYDSCLQVQIKAVESLLDAGLGLDDVDGRKLTARFDLDDLLKMDSATQVATLNDSVKGGWLKPNEARAKRGYGPVEGGDTPYLQQQNFGLAALAKRDDLPNPFVIDRPAANPSPSDAGPAVSADPAAKAASNILRLHDFTKQFRNAA